MKPTTILTHYADRVTQQSNYWMDDTGILFNPNPIPRKQRLNRMQHEPSPQEKAADKNLGEVLHTRYVKKNEEGLTFLDVLPQTDELGNVFSKYGYKTYTTDMDIEDGTKFDLITSIHTFQWFTVTEALKFLTYMGESLKDDGHIFIRMPDTEAKGFEVTLSSNDALPTFWNLKGFLELLSRIGVLRIVETYTIEPGQRDYFIRKFPKKPLICAGMIVKNEERDLPKCLKSIEQVVQGVMLLDTGSTDNTLGVFKEWFRDNTHRLDVDYHVYTDASEKDENGDWKLWDFGKARNEYVRLIEENGHYEYILWMDADDVLQDIHLKNLVYLECVDIHGIGMNSGGTQWIHHRLWKASKKVRYSGRCHEYPHFPNCRSMDHHDLVIFHDAAPTTGENSNSRNLRILQREVEEAPTPRNCFYLANTHKDGGRYELAAKYYGQRIAFGKGFEEEYWFAMLYKVRCHRELKQYDVATSLCLAALSEVSGWAEFWMELAYIESARGNHKKSLGYCMIAQDLPVLPSNLFREKNKYTDQPYRIASWAAEHLGMIDMALAYAYAAQKQIGGPDADWDKRTLRLLAQSGESAGK